MNEEDKAQKLSDAIDALLEGREPDLDDEDLRELLGVARLRLRAGKALADVGLTYQELLRRVLQARMVSRQMTSDEEEEDPPPEAHDITEIADPKEYLDPLDPGYGKLVNFLDFWPRAGEPNPTAATRSTAAATKLDGPPVVIPLWKAAEQHKATKADSLAPIVDRLVRNRKRTLPVSDDELEELVQVAHLRRYVGQTLASAGTPYKRRLWSVLRLRLAANLRRQAAQPPRPTISVAAGRSWKYAVAAAAAVALTLFTVGPWAASGFAQNPINQVFDFVGGHVGVQGVDEPPPTQVPTTIPVEKVSPEQAAERLGLPVSQPTYLPEGFELASSHYYTQSISTPEQGMFVLGYAPGGKPLSGEPEIIIYQEQATPSTIAQKSAYIEEVVLGGSLPATYVQGIWQVGPDGTLEWVEDNAEVLVFDHDGVRTFIVYHFGGQEKDELLKIAESMLTS
jgi:nitroreductase